MKTAVHVDGTLNDPSDRDKQWSVEIAIPWKVLAEHAGKPAPPKDGDQWRVNFSRVQWKHTVEEGKYVKVPKLREDNWVWSPQGIIDMHRPERWGYVQFSTQTNGDVPFRADPTLAARDRLMGVYHAQKSFFKKHERWAKSLKELDLLLAGAHAIPRLRTTKDGYEASLPVVVDGKRRTLVVRQDSRLRLAAEK